MTCNELRERIVDSAAASQGGHAPVVDHLDECAACRAAAREYGALDRLVRPALLPSPPADFETRLRLRLSVGSRRSSSSAWLLGGALGVLALAAFFTPRFLRTRQKAGQPAPAVAASAPVPPPASAAALAPDARPPDIVAVGSAPISFQSAPLSAKEKAEAVALHDFDFLNSFRTLAHLDAFFPEPVGPRAPVPVPAGGFPSRPPDTPDAITGRTLDWQRSPRAERARLSELETSFRDRPEEERALLEDRWTLVRDFSEDQRAGLRRLASRMNEFDSRAHDRLESEVRLIGRLPKEQRAARWRALPFTKPLTGQELASAERLLLSR